MSGKPGRSGRRKKPSTLINEALALNDQNFPAIFQIIIDKALKGDKECAIYLVDRRLGRPHQSIDNRISAKIPVTAEAYRTAISDAEDYEREMLASQLLLEQPDE